VRCRQSRDRAVDPGSRPPTPATGAHRRRGSVPRCGPTPGGTVQRPRSGTERSGDQPDHSARGGQADSAARSSGVPHSGQQTRAAQALAGELTKRRDRKTGRCITAGPPFDRAQPSGPASRSGPAGLGGQPRGRRADGPPQRRPPGETSGSPVVQRLGPLDEPLTSELLSSDDRVQHAARNLWGSFGASTALGGCGSRHFRSVTDSPVLRNGVGLPIPALRTIQKNVQTLRPTASRFRP
jgi:hypothetical protein